MLEANREKVTFIDTDGTAVQIELPTKGLSNNALAEILDTLLGIRVVTLKREHV